MNRKTRKLFNWHLRLYLCSLRYCKTLWQLSMKRIHLPLGYDGGRLLSPLTESWYSKGWQATSILEPTSGFKHRFNGTGWRTLAVREHKKVLTASEDEQKEKKETGRRRTLLRLKRKSGRKVCTKGKGTIWINSLRDRWICAINKVWITVSKGTKIRKRWVFFAERKLKMRRIYEISNESVITNWEERFISSYARLTPQLVQTCCTYRTWISYWKEALQNFMVFPCKHR